MLPSSRKYFIGKPPMNRHTTAMAMKTSPVPRSLPPTTRPDGGEHTGYDGDHGVPEGRHLPELLREDEAEPQGQGDLEEF
jgi:hypothetical protein